MAIVPAFIDGKPLIYDGSAGPRLFSNSSDCGCCFNCGCFSFPQSGQLVLPNPEDYAISVSGQVHNGVGSLIGFSGIMDWNAANDRWELEGMSTCPGSSVSRMYGSASCAGTNPFGIPKARATIGVDVYTCDTSFPTDTQSAASEFSLWTPGDPIFTGIYICQGEVYHAEGTGANAGAYYDAQLIPAA